jgi:hypothetical protein
MRRTFLVVPLAVSLIVVAALACTRDSAGASERRAAATSLRGAGTSASRMEIVQLPIGTRITFSIDEGLSSQASRAGDSLTGTLHRDVLIGGRTAIPAGAAVVGVVTSAHSPKTIGGGALLEFEVNLLVTPSGQEIPVLARFARAGADEEASDSATIATGDIVGAIIGQQITTDTGGRATGGLFGAGIGSAIAAEPKGETINLPAGTIIELAFLGPAAVQIES